MDDSTPNSFLPQPIQPKPSEVSPLPSVTQGQDPKPRGRKRFLTAILIVVVSAVAGFLGGWVATTHFDNETEPTIQKQQVILKTQGQLISHIADTVGASVVSIDITTQSVSANSFLGFSLPSVQRASGTGIILTKEGLIITNRHVVPAGTTTVSVTLSDGTTYEDVEVVGRTTNSDTLDIAFLKIKDLKGKTLTPAEIGDSSSMKVGDPVVAIGNALGEFSNSVTSGIISGFGRNVQASDDSGQTSESLVGLIQTDAAINQGNSGGPLVNLEGKVIGINTAVAQAENIGFAIPINDVKGMIDSVQKTGKLQRPYLGVLNITLNEEIAKQVGLTLVKGAYIPLASASAQSPVAPGSPAEKAGLKEGDVITKVNDDVIDSKKSLSSLINKRKVGEKITLTVMRDGKELKLEATLTAAEQ